jgi:hypothetical protein
MLIIKVTLGNIYRDHAQWHAGSYTIIGTADKDLVLCRSKANNKELVAV